MAKGTGRRCNKPSVVSVKNGTERYCCQHALEKSNLYKKRSTATDGSTLAKSATRVPRGSRSSSLKSGGDAKTSRDTTSSPQVPTLAESRKSKQTASARAKRMLQSTAAASPFLIPAGFQTIHPQLRGIGPSTPQQYALPSVATTTPRAASNLLFGVPTAGGVVPLSSSAGQSTPASQGSLYPSPSVSPVVSAILVSSPSSAAASPPSAAPSPPSATSLFGTGGVPITTRFATGPGGGRLQTSTTSVLAEAWREPAPLTNSADWITFSKRYTLADALHEGVIISDPCDMQHWLTDRNWLKKKQGQSASNTLLLFAKLLYAFVSREEWQTTASGREFVEYWKQRLQTGGDTEVVLKISFESLRPDWDNSLNVEIAIYERFIYKLLNWRATPNVMLLVKWYKCQRFQETLKRQPKEIANEFQELIKQLKNEYQGDVFFDWKVVNMLVLERGRGSSFSDWMTSEPRTEEQWFSVLFQIFYTIECFGLAGFQHNDLHRGNIWIDHPVKPVRSPQMWIYFVDPTVYYVVPIRDMVKIYDFDRSYAWRQTTDPRTGQQTLELRNTLLDSVRTGGTESICSRYGQCNIAQPKNDAFHVLFDLWQVLKNPSKRGVYPPEPSKRFDRIQQWVLEWFHGRTDLLDAVYPSGGLYCDLDRKAKTPTCLQPGEPPADTMQEAFEMLNFFPMFRGQLPQYDIRFLPDRYPNVFVLPTVSQSPSLHQQWQDALKPENIVPVLFT